MRRSDREITDFSEIVRIMEQCDVCRLAMHDDYPYILPLNFGMAVKGTQVTLYFHGANKGKKYDLLARDSRVGFEMDRGHRLALEEETGNCTMAFESVMGHGTIELVPEGEKYSALKILMRHYHAEDFPFDTRPVKATAVLKMTVADMTAKRRDARP